MHKRWMVGSLAVAVLGLAGMRAADLALRRAKAAGPVIAMPDESKVERIRWKSPIVSQPADDDRSPAPAGGEPLPMALPAANSRAAEPVLDDPMGAVDSFLRRSRQEADESIKALTQEAEALRARLQKVEAALARWQAVAGALNPDGQRRWREPASEVAPLLEPASAPKDAAIPARDVEPPLTLPPDLPANTTLPSPGPAAPASTESVPLPPPTIPTPK